MTRARPATARPDPSAPPAAAVRHLAHLGRPVRLGVLLPGLLAQARAGALADGVGVGWYLAPDLGRPGGVPLRYRRAAAPWADAGLEALGAAVESGCVLAAGRAAPGGPADESACPPLLLARATGGHGGGGHDGAVLLSHDGEVPGVAGALGRLVPSAAAVHLVAGRVPEAGLGLLATDGRSIAGVAWGAPLVWRAGEGAVVVADAATDAGAGWADVPDRSLLSATLDGVEVDPL